MAKLTIRKPRRDEFMQIIRLIAKSANDLRVRNGRRQWDNPPSEVPSFNYHLFETDPEGHKCAYYDGRIVGFSAAVIRGRQWYLAYLFVDPDFQLKGVGRKLLDHAMDYGRDKVESHALCTFSYNETALALYSSYGMMPTTPIFEMQKKIDKTAKPPKTSLHIEQDNSQKAILQINRLEKEIRGYPRLIDWRFFGSDPRQKIFQFYDGAKWVGYSVVASNRLIAPAGSTEPKYLPEIVAESYRQCLESGSESCLIWAGGPNAPLFARLKGLGFRLNELASFLSSKPYGDFSRYCPAHLAIF